MRREPERFQMPPAGSSVFKELQKGRMCDRTGSRGRATIEKRDGIYRVETHHPRRTRTFEHYWSAIGYFNRCVGHVKALAAAPSQHP